MKKEKKIRTYQRRTKSGKLVTVKAHTAKYDAAEKAKELAKKKGAGDELEERKKFMVLGVDLSAFSDEELKELDFIEYDDNGKAVHAPKTRAGLKRFAEKYYSDPDSADAFREGMADFYAEVKERRLNAKKSSAVKPTKEAKTDAEEYGKVPAHLGMTQQNWNDWMDGGDTYTKANKLAKKHLENLYGKKAATHIIKKYEGDGTNGYIDIVSSATPVKGVVAELKKLGIYEPSTSASKISEPKSKAKSKETKSATSEPAFTAAEFKEWYQGTGSAADKKVAKALRAQLGRSGYKKLEDEAIDNYSARGHLSMFKRVSAPTTETPTKTASKMKESAKAKTSTSPKSASKKESVYEKYGTTHKEVVAYMKASPRKWKWDASDKVFYTSRMPDGGTAKSPYKVSLESAIKRMQKAQGKSTKDVDTTPKSETTARKSKTKKSYTTAKRMKPSEVADMTTKRDWIYND